MAGNSSHFDMMFRNAQEIAAWRLCLGCGACAYACPEQRIRLVDIKDKGIRPIVDGGDCGSCVECVKVCPGIEGPNPVDDEQGGIAALKSSWGTVLEMWEGYAADPEMRFKGSSGGAASALALYGLEQKGMDAVLHVRSDEEDPTTCRPVLSKTRSDLLTATGSRYAPAAPCEGLRQIEPSSGSCMFIGKPCDVQGLRKCEAVREDLRHSFRVAIGIFCAGTPSRLGTLDLLKQMNIDPDRVAAIRYRGQGWPGHFEVTFHDGSESKKISYRDAWGFLQRYRPYRCHLCPDGTAESADISCGDPWYRTREEADSGHSLILVRTRAGKTFLRGALSAGYLHASPVRHDALAESQKNLSEKKAALWGRLLTMRLFGIPTPRYDLLPFYRSWLGLPLSDKLRSTLGTARRVIQRRYWNPDPMKH